MTRFSAATLAIYSETELASDVTAVLGVVPTKTHEKGDAPPSRTERIYPGYQTSAWLLDADKGSIDPGDDSGFAALRALLTQIDGLADALASLRPRYRTVIRWSGDVSPQGNFVIDAATIVALGRLGCEFFGTAHHEDAETLPEL